MAYALIVDGSPRELSPYENVELAGNRHTSYGSILVWSDEERAAEGIYPIAEPDAIDPSLVETGRALSVLKGRPVRTVTTAPRPLTSSDVNAERDRRMWTFNFGGVDFDFDDRSRGDIAGAGILAFAAIINGAQPGDLRWADPDYDFAWIAKDNKKITMDAQTTFAFGQAAAKWRSSLIFKARAIKDSGKIPADYTADVHWA